MLLRKINAGISLLITVMLMCHAIFNAVRMLTRGDGNPAIAGYMAWILSGLMVLHAIISILLGILAHKDGNKEKFNSYPKLNCRTLVQRITGILIILFTALHIAGAAGFMTPPQIVHAIVVPIFFFITLAHVGVSASKAFITLGIGNATFIKVADVAFKILSVVTLIAAVAGFYLFNFAEAGI
jgi:hypothetical protein